MLMKKDLGKKLKEHDSDEDMRLTMHMKKANPSLKDVMMNHMRPETIEKSDELKKKND